MRSYGAFCVSGRGGIYAVCSAHPAVIEAAVRQSLEDGSVLLVESTSSQVNQFGGYTRVTPSEFAISFIPPRRAPDCQRSECCSERITLGLSHGDMKRQPGVDFGSNSTFDYDSCESTVVVCGTVKAH